jgi:hypothetical protein
VEERRADLLDLSQTIDMKLKAPQGTPGAKFCFAVADRKVLRLLRDSRWDLVRPLTLRAHRRAFTDAALSPADDLDYHL